MKGRTTEEKEQSFSWDGGASVGSDLDPFNIFIRKRSMPKEKSINEKAE